MKTSCSTNLLNAAGAENIMQAIDLADKLGFDGINIETDDKTFFSIEDFSFLKSSEIARHAITREIEIQCLNISAVDFNEIKKEISRLSKAASIAHALSCPLVAFSTSVLDEKTGIFKQFEKTSEIIKKAAKLADDFDICFAVEAAQNSLTDTFEKALQLFVEVDEHNFGVVLNSISFNKNNLKQLGNDIDLIDESLLFVKITGEEESVPLNNILEKLGKHGDSLYVSDSRCRLIENPKTELLNFIKLIKSLKLK